MVVLAEAVGGKGKPMLGIGLCPCEEKLLAIPESKEPGVIHLPAGGLLVSLGNSAISGATMVSVAGRLYFRGSGS